MTYLNKKMVSIVLGSYNRRPFLKATLESVRANGMDFPYEIIVVDGGSTDGSLKYLAAQKDVITIIQHNRGEWRGKIIERRSWGYFMNLGFKSAQGKYILMISDDSLLVPGAMQNGVKQFEKLLEDGQKIGAMAFYWRNWPEQEEYWVGLTLGEKMFVNHGLFLRSALDEIGWIDEETYQFYHADGDLCLKLWQNGYQVVDCKAAFVEHCDHVKPVKYDNTQDWQNYLNKWTGIYFDPTQNITGGWNYQAFVDSHKTHKQFPLSSQVKLRLNKVFRIILEKIWVLKRKVRNHVRF